MSRTDTGEGRPLRGRVVDLGVKPDPLNITAMVLIVVGLLAIFLVMAGCRSAGTPAQTVITPGTATSSFTSTEDRGRRVIITVPEGERHHSPFIMHQWEEPRLLVRVVPVEPVPKTE